MDGDVPEGAMITAGIGDYRSRPVRAVGDAYAGLVVEPEDHQLLGEPIEFYLDDTRRTKSTPTQSPTPSPTPALKVGLGVSITTEPSGRESEGQQSASAASTPTEEISTPTAKELAEAI